MTSPPQPFRSARRPDASDEWDATDPMRPDGRPVPRLWRSRSNRVIAGVLGGLAEKFGIDAQPLRLLYGFLTLGSGGLLAIPYLAIWAIAQAHGPQRSLPRLWRSRTNKVVAGVLGGMAEKWGMNATFLRVLFAVLSVFSAGFPGILIYLVLWMVTSPLDEFRDRDY